MWVPTVCDLCMCACTHVCLLLCLCNVCSCVPVHVCVHTYACVMCLRVGVPVYDTHMMYVFGQMDTVNHLYDDELLLLLQVFCSRNLGLVRCGHSSSCN